MLELENKNVEVWLEYSVWWGSTSVKGKVLATSDKWLKIETKKHIEYIHVPHIKKVAERL